MAKSARRIPPSRVKYEQANPTVSGRVTLEIYDRLQAVKEAEGKSFADVLKMDLGILEAQAKEEGVVRKQAHAEGYRKGYAEAQRLYKVTYTCNVCGEMLTVTSPEEKAVIKQYMREHGWGHEECHEKRQ